MSRTSSFAVLDRDNTARCGPRLCPANRRIALFYGKASDRQPRPGAGPASCATGSSAFDRSTARLRPRHIARGRRVEVGAWIDGAMPHRAETVRGYVQGCTRNGCRRRPRQRPRVAAAARRAQPGDRATAITPPSRASHRHGAGGDPAPADDDPVDAPPRSASREKELGSIINFYVDARHARSEFLLGKKLPYVLLAMLNFLLLTRLSP